MIYFKVQVYFSSLSSSVIKIISKFDSADGQIYKQYFNKDFFIILQFLTLPYDRDDIIITISLIQKNNIPKKVIQIAITIIQNQIKIKNISCLNKKNYFHCFYKLKIIIQEIKSTLALISSEVQKLRYYIQLSSNLKNLFFILHLFRKKDDYQILPYIYFSHSQRNLLIEYHCFYQKIVALFEFIKMSKLHQFSKYLIFNTSLQQQLMVKNFIFSKIAIKFYCLELKQLFFLYLNLQLQQIKQFLQLWLSDKALKRISIQIEMKSI
ncbi:unnamed protein product [Paramecium octaurelia]|uniref:Uncharacterized protein n=1 Tax=Paramecium octaurelia TaxID=43137 RepID=A0A8S1VI30_PAROT|nr:unnamed protein product [Paramecium octaurelia]